MAKKNSINLESLCTGILFCISLVALIIACLAYNKKPSVGGGEYYCGARTHNNDLLKVKKKKKYDDDNN